MDLPLFIASFKAIILLVDPFSNSGNAMTHLKKNIGRLLGIRALARTPRLALRSLRLLFLRRRLLPRLYRRRIPRNMTNDLLRIPRFNQRRVHPSR